MSDTLADAYTGRANIYKKFRGAYSEINVQELYECSGITTSSIIADIGSGTGKFTKLLLNQGNTVHAVEPNVDMYNEAVSELKQFPNFIPHNATAEDTGLQDKSIDVITAAMAFNKFDKTRCKKEFLRILKPEGKVVLVWYKPNFKHCPFLQHTHEVLNELLHKYRQAMNPEVQIKKENEHREFFINGQCSILRYPYTIKNTWDNFFGGLLSAAWAPMEGEPLYLPMKEQMHYIFNQYAVDSTVECKYVTDVYYGFIGV